VKTREVRFRAVVFIDGSAKLFPLLRSLQFQHSLILVRFI